MERILANKKIFIPWLIVLIVIGYYVFDTFQNKQHVEIDDGWLEDEYSADIDSEQEASIETNVMVDIKGSVNMPGVYVASSGERVIDLVKRAGGLTADAAEELVNFAMYVEDEMVIYIPAKGADGEVQLESMSMVGTSDTGGKININKASQAELETLSGIGPAKATAIIEYREKSGPFEKIEDLMSVSGIGEKTFEKLADQITVK